MIKGFSEPKRIPRVGKIYLGVKTENTSGKQYPTATDYFVVRPDGVNTSDGAATAFYSVYGQEPREITVAFPSDDPENFMPQYLAAYRGGGGRHELWCKGDGETAGRADGAGGYLTIPCGYRECPIYQENKCKELTRLLFLLPDVEGIGVWELDTTSYHSAQNLVSSIQLIRQLTRGKIAMIPLKLRVVPKVVNPDGKTKTVYVLDLKLENIKLMDLLNRIPQLGMEEPMQLVDPINHNEMPDDLYVDRNLVDDNDIQSVSSDTPPPETASRNRTQRNTTAPQQRLPEISEDVAAVAEVEFKPFEGKAEGIALLKLADYQSNQLVEVITTDPSLLQTIKSLQLGTVVRWDCVTSERFRNRKELSNLAIVS